MTLLKHELRQNKTAFLIWTAVISFMLAICVFVYPEMSSQMEDFGDVFASMGSFTEAFGLDQLNFGTLVGFYAVECGNVLGLGGAFFACLIGVAAISKEERNGTAEFLLTQPITRQRVLQEKLLAIVVQIIAMNAIILGISLGAMAAISQEIPLREILLMHAAYLILQLELGCVCFGISAFLSKGSVGVGLGLGTAMYFLNILANMTDSMAFLKYITPFGYCDGADIVTEGRLNWGMILVGVLLAAAGILAAYGKYSKKDVK